MRTKNNQLVFAKLARRGLLTFVENQHTMLKLLFWGAIIYIVYRYFQMKDQLKEGRKKDFVQQQQNRQEPTVQQKPKEGEYIDYEEIK